MVGTKYRTASALIFAAFLSVAASSNVDAATVVIESTVGGFIADFGTQDGTPDGSNGGAISVANFPTGPSGDQHRGIIEFGISGLGSPVSSATLTLNNFSSNLTAVRTIDVNGFVGNGTLDFTDYTIAGTSLGSFAYFNEAVVNFDVTAFINTQIGLGNDFAGFQLVWGSAPIAAEFATFFGQGVQTSDIPFRPKLAVEVSAVPLPAALPLFLAALSGLGFFGWRRKSQAVA